MAKIDVDRTYKGSVAGAMIVMVLSIIAVIIIYVTIGHIATYIPI
jgi:hypothetical protein